MNPRKILVDWCQGPFSARESPMVSQHLAGDISGSGCDNLTSRKLYRLKPNNLFYTMSLFLKNFILGLHSTEVALVLLTQQSQARISSPPKFFR